MHLINGTSSQSTDLPAAIRTVGRHMEVTCVWVRIALLDLRDANVKRVIIANEMYFITIVAIAMRSILCHQMNTQRREKLLDV